MTRTRKGGARSAHGWSFDRGIERWACDQHGSHSCTVCERPIVDTDDQRDWAIDPDGALMPVPTSADLIPDVTEVATRQGVGMPAALLVVDMRDRELADITRDVLSFCNDQRDGLLNVFLPHATAGLAIVELGYGTEHDVVQHLERIAPLDDAYANVCGKGDEGADHLLPVLLAPSLTIPVIGGIPSIGSSQSIVLIDRFYPAKRRVQLSFLAYGASDSTRTAGTSE